ncbi:M28 family peptidase [Alkalimonas amylolytica]|uniref:Peptidase family M28 n=1 Tax=Alkalimonas amylolytica TaxID=152573 RepID=A0A1H4DDQ0_ALKAM|nr:M28 family peptidase [Alkalimonas amylolytica]SEA70372.1 Peptidase family M28 [Alkalimonas amylolytica]
MSTMLKRLIAWLVLLGVLVFAGQQWGYPAWQSWLTEREVARIEALKSLPLPVAAQPGRLDPDRMMQDLSWMAHPDRQGRESGQPGALATRHWLLEQYQQIGLQPAGVEGYLHEYEVQEHIQFSGVFRQRQRHIEAISNAANVLGSLPGKQAGLPYIAISAHYDHLGVRNGEVFHGADDNASGVAAMLELARYFAQHPTEHPLLFMALDSEEKGLQGAVALFRDQAIRPDQLAFNVNLDMLSRDTERQLFAVGTYQHPWLHPLLDRVQQQSSVRLIRAHDRPWWRAGRTENWVNSSDHGVFHRHGVPFIYFGVADHPDYHTPRDTSDRVDAEFYQAVSETVLDFILRLDQQLAAKAQR